MEADKTEGTLEQAAQIIEEQFARREREAARDLLQDAFVFLPPELQDLYYGVVELYRAGKWREASELFEEWLDQARELDLL